MKINQFADAMKRLQAEIELAAAEGLAEAAEIIKTEAQNMIGHVHDGVGHHSPRGLSPRKAAEGYDVPAPLLATWRAARQHRGPYPWNARRDRHQQSIRTSPRAW